MGTETHGLAPTPQILAQDADPGNPANPANPANPDPLQPNPQNPAPVLGGADGVQPEVYKPEGIEQHLLGQTNQETIDKMLARMSGLRTELAKKAPDGRPEKPDGYQWNWSDKVKASGTIAGDDQAVKMFSDIAHEHGFSQQQLDAVPKFFDMLVEKGMIEAPFDANKLLEDLAPDTFRGSVEEKKSKGSERLGQAENWITQLTPQQGFDDAMKSEMRLLTTSAAGIKVLETLMRSGSNPSIAPAGGGQAPAVTQDSVNARLSDPRNDAMNPKFDEAFALATREMFKKLYPG